MNRFIIKALALLFCLFIVDFGIGRKLDHFYESNFCQNSGGALNYYFKFQKADTIFIGSSRVYSMIIPNIIGENVLNVADASKHLYYNTAVVSLMEKYNKLPKKMLVLNLEAEDVYKENKAKLIDDVFYLKYYYDKDQYIKSLINSKNYFEKFKFIMSSYRFNGENFLIITNKIQKICDNDFKSYYPIYKSSKDSLNVIKGIREYKKTYSDKINKDVFKAIKKIQTICKRHKLKFVILYGPHFYYPEFLKKASSFVEKFCIKNNIVYLDFNKEEYKQFNKINSWVDITHLNHQASIIYSKLIKTELKKIDN
jgi:hypothetical protein